MRSYLWLVLALGACNDKKTVLDQPDAPPGGDAAIDGTGSDGNMPPDKVPLVVASTHGILVWRDSAALTADAAPDVTINGFGLAMGTTALAAHGDRLYVGRTANPGGILVPALLAFDAAHSLTDSSSPAVQIPRPHEATTLRVDANDHLWADEANLGGQVVRFDGASTLAMDATPKAVFTNPKNNLPAFALEPVSDRLYAGQVTGSGIIGWNQASTKTGTLPPDFTFAAGSYTSMQIDTDRLYCAGGTSSSSGNAVGVTIWPHISGVVLPPPPIHLTTGFALGRLPHLAIANDTLAVAARDENKVFVYLHASAITADRAADAVLTDHIKSPIRVALEGDRLYVADAEGIAIFANVSTTPTFVAKLSAPATDLLLLN